MERAVTGNIVVGTVISSVVVVVVGVAVLVVGLVVVLGVVVEVVVVVVVVVVVLEVVVAGVVVELIVLGMVAIVIGMSVVVSAISAPGKRIPAVRLPISVASRSPKLTSTDPLVVLPPVVTAGRVAVEGDTVVELTTNKGVVDLSASICIVTSPEETFRTTVMLLFTEFGMLKSTICPLSVDGETVFSVVETVGNVVLMVVATTVKLSVLVLAVMVLLVVMVGTVVVSVVASVVGLVVCCRSSAAYFRRPSTGVGSVVASDEKV